MTKFGAFILAFLSCLYSLNVTAKVNFYHRDLTGSVVAVTNDAGQVEWTKKYSPFGEETHNGSSDNIEQGFGGHERDQGIGMVYMKARYYDEVVARFISSDPVDFSEENLGGINAYHYANNSPLVFNDPSGRILNFAVGAGVNVVVGGVIRGLTGGEIFNPGAIALDAAIGVATSGLGAIAQIRNTSSLVNIAWMEGRVVGTAQGGTFLHAAASEQAAVRLLNQGAETVYLNRAYSTATGIRGIEGSRRLPDALGVFDNLSVKSIEIASKTDDVGILYSRNMDAIGNMGLDGSVDVVSTAFSFRTGLFGGQKTFGAAGLQMDSFGAGVTFGSQAAYQTYSNWDY